MTLPRLFIVCLCSAFATVSTAEESAFPEVFNTQDPGDGLTPPEEALRGMRVPPGFNVTLFAAEPDVRQPIALATDERGRLWVAENYTYAESKTNYETKLRDRIVILEDTDNDGRFDRRKVFWDQAKKLTSIEIGFGGVWALCAPNLLFIPDRDRDDVPDAEPDVLLDGFDDFDIRHNIVNGLRWGPDGWLYGRHGITTTSLVGTPGAERVERVKMNCGIWRFHPTRKVFEVVCRGTTNPWGMDWDDHGQMFFINSVIGHFWHVIPGAYYQRMHGEHFDPHLFELLPQTADHYHWDTKERWHDIGKLGVTSGTDAAGGGHAHCGMTIYLGDNFPAKYRNSVFAANLHGRRLNRERIKRHGATYVATHEPDFMHAADPWFRGTELVYGPDGGVYVADWSDIGECHDNDGIHRTSGRIYKMTYDGKPKAGQLANRSQNTDSDLSALNNSELVRLQLHKNDWYVRHARRLLQQRGLGGADMGAAHMALREQYRSQKDVTRRLRAMWCLYVTGGLSQSWLLDQLHDKEEHIRVWAIQLLVDNRAPSDRAREAFEELAKTERSGLVLTFLASSLRLLPTDQRWTLANTLAAHDQFADDRVFPLMLWYGIEPAASEQPDKAVQLVAATEIRKLRRFITRRLTGQIERQPEAVGALARLAIEKDDVKFQRDILDGMTAALEGWHNAEPPSGWNDVALVLAKSPDTKIKQSVRELSLVFGDGRAVDELETIAASGDDLGARRAAIRALVAVRAQAVVPLLQKLLDHRELAADAVAGLSAFDHPDTPELLIRSFGGFRQPAREAAINVLVSRPAYADKLLSAVAGRKINRRHVSAFQLRQMQSFEDASIAGQIDELWPELKTLSEEKRAKISTYRNLLTDDVLSAADLSAGRALFEQSCAKCHRLFGRGGGAGPDLTGSQRNNVNYLLENIIDPSATVSKNYNMSVVILEDGRVITGIVMDQNDRTVTLRTPDERLVLTRDEIEEIRPSQLSLMPEGQLDILKDEQVRNLIAYLMSPQQVPMP